MMNGTQMTQMTRIYADFFNYSALIRVIRVICVLMPFLLVQSTVFVINKDLAQGVISGKYFWFYGSMGLVSITTLITAFCYKSRFRFSVLDLLLLLFAGSIYLSALVFNDAAENTTKLTVLALLLVLYFCLRIIAGALRATPLRRVLCGFIVITGLVEAVWGLLQLYGFTASQHYLFKTTGSFFNPGPFAGYLAVTFPLALHYWVQGKRLKVQGKTLSSFAFYLLPCTLCLLTCIAILLVLPAAMSRASWLAVIAGSAVVLYKDYNKYITVFFNRTKPKVPFRETTFGVSQFRGRGLVMLIAILLLFAASTGLYYLKKNSADGRLLMWKTALRTATEHPLGVGLGHFPDAYGETQAAYFASGRASETEELVAGSPEYGFNEYLQIAVESGVTGLLLFLAMIVLAIRNYLKNKQYGLLGSLIALLVFACFSYPFSVLPFPVVLCFLLAAAQVKTTEDTEGTEKNETRCPLCPLWLILFSTLSFFIIAKQYPVYKAYRQWKHAQYFYHSGLYRDAGEEYARLYPYLNDRINFLFEYGRSLSNTGQYEEGNKVLHRAAQISCDPMLYSIMGKNYQAMKDYRQAETCFIRAARIVPNRLYPWYLLTKLYDEMGLPDKVRETAAVVLTKEPKVQSQAIKEMREEVKKLKTKS
ncbi:hypothetical protein AGMMS50239_24940 [Bacteroidia bacterium]|nr:hypothetical protein AGMMS50239_24940 [Bacteroidia bacterium]